MARVEKKIARKEYRCDRAGCKIRPGEEYYTWTFFRQRPQRNCRLHPPRGSETEPNDKLRQVYAARESVDAAIEQARDGGDAELTDLVQALRDAAGEVREAAEAWREIADSEYFQGSERNEQAGQNADDAESYADEFEQVADEIEGEMSSFEADPDSDKSEDEQLEEFFLDLIDKAEGVDFPL